jgi:hypothetical protein
MLESRPTTPERRNDSRPRTPERRNATQNGNKKPKKRWMP